jgi:hypothetical protein
LETASSRRVSKDLKSKAGQTLSLEIIKQLLLISFYVDPRDDACAVCGSTSFFYAIS